VDSVTFHNSSSVLQINTKNFTINITHIYIHGATAPSGPGPHCASFTIVLKHTTLCKLLWASDQPDAENSTEQHSQQTDIHSPPGYENAQSQQVNGRRPTPYTARPLGSAVYNTGLVKLVRQLAFIPVINCTNMELLRKSVP